MTVLEVARELKIKKKAKGKLIFACFNKFNDANAFLELSNYCCEKEYGYKRNIKFNGTEFIIRIK